LARIVLEDAVLYILAFHLAVSIFFSVSMFDSYFPGKIWNSTNMSMDPAPAGYNYTPNAMFGNTSNQLNKSLETFNSSLSDPYAMINPLRMLDLISAYIGLFIMLFGHNYLYVVIALIAGDRWAFALTFFINVLFVILSVRVISGRIRWD
jgi:hypothetical protein